MQALTESLGYWTAELARWLGRLLSAPFTALLSAIFCAALSMPCKASGDDAAKLLLKPQRCVALHQGQQCYQTVNILWRAPTVGNYCVYVQGHEEPIGCWLETEQGELRHEFVSDTTLVFELRDVQQAKVLTESRLEVAWVYHRNARRKSHWRIF